MRWVPSVIRRGGSLPFLTGYLEAVWRDFAFVTKSPSEWPVRHIFRANQCAGRAPAVEEGPEGRPRQKNPGKPGGTCPARPGQPGGTFPARLPSSIQFDRSWVPPLVTFWQSSGRLLAVFWPFWLAVLAGERQPERPERDQRTAAKWPKVPSRRVFKMTTTPSSNYFQVPLLSTAGGVTLMKGAVSEV